MGKCLMGSAPEAQNTEQCMPSVNTEPRLGVPNRWRFGRRVVRTSRTGGL